MIPEQLVEKLILELHQNWISGDVKDLPGASFDTFTDLLEIRINEIYHKKL